MSLGEADTWCQDLYEKEAASILLYGRALGLSHCEAEDVLQDTFLALTRMGSPPSEPRHYALRAFRNRAINYRRSLWRRCLREMESRHWFERTDQTHPCEQAVQLALARLPLEQREVIVLKIWHQFTYEQMSHLLGVNAHTLAGRYRYGIQKLRNTLTSLTYEADAPAPHGEAIRLLDTAAPLP